MHSRKILLAALFIAAACSSDDDEAAARNAAAATPASAPTDSLTVGATAAGETRVSDTGGTPSNAQSGSRPASGGGPGGRPSPSITLSASDIATVRRDVIEEGIPVTGDLRPIETIEVRARIEGDLVGVYVREGERVRTGQVLARFESSEQESGYTSAEADRVAAQSELATARWNLEQTAELFRAGAVSERDYKAAQQGVTTAEARLAAAQARLRASTSLVRDTRVLAPQSGTISRRLVENGEHVARGAGLFTLVRSDVLELAAAVPARLANSVNVGQNVQFNADGRAFTGRVARVSPTVDPTSRSVAVFVQIPNPTGALKGGTFASGRVVSRVLSGALVVPTAAVRQSAGEGRPYVYRIAANRTIDVASVQLGVSDERAGITEVLDGLEAGDRVIVGNMGTLGRGMQVIIAGEERAGRPASARQ